MTTAREGDRGSPFRVLVAEDEEPARDTIRALVKADPDLEWVGETWGERTTEEIRRLRPHLVLLDIQMPGMDGFQVLESLEPDERPAVIFVTAYDEYAVDAFEVRALDYVLKPFTDARFREAVARAKERLATSAPAPPGIPSGVRARPDSQDRSLAAVETVLRDRLVIREGSRSLVLPREEVLWIEASGQYVMAHVRGGDHYLVRIALGTLEEQLRPWGFFRVHRSALVNLDAVREIRPLSHGDGLVVLSGGTEVKLSRSRREEFEAVLVRGAEPGE